MKLEKERNSTRISYFSKASAGEVSEAFESVCSKVEGIYLPSDVRKDQEGVIINIRHRESLKVYLEKNVFKMDDYIELLKRVKKLYIELAENGYDPEKCVWDVDAIFVGESLSDLEAVYPVLSDEEVGDGSPLTDLLAVASLHVFDSRENAIEALSEVVKQFSLWERGEAGCIITNDIFDDSIRILSSFASGSGIIRQYASVLGSRIKKYIKSSQVIKRETASEGVGLKHTGTGKENREIAGKLKRLTAGADEKRSVIRSENGSQIKKKSPGSMKENKSGTGFESGVIFSGIPEHMRGNGRKGLEGRLVKYGPSNEIAVDVDVKTVEEVNKTAIDAIPGKSKYTELKHKTGPGPAETHPADKTTVISRAFAEEAVGLPCPFVSREHAALVRAGKLFLLTEKGSANGTYLNGERITPGLYYKLKKGDNISLGHIRVSLLFDPGLMRRISSEHAIYR